MLLTRLTNMIRVLFALGTEIFSTLVASDSEFSHMSCTLFRKLLSLIVFLIEIYFTFFDFHYIPALTSNYISTLIQNEVIH